MGEFTYSQEYVLPIATVRAGMTKDAPVTLEVLNPRGEIPPPPTMGIRPRVADLREKTIGLCDNGKFGADNLLDAIEAAQTCGTDHYIDGGVVSGGGGEGGCLYLRHRGLRVLHVVGFPRHD